MYTRVIPPRLFLAVGLCLLLFSLVLGCISLFVPDWLQYNEHTNSTNTPTEFRNVEDSLKDNKLASFRRFGLWKKCQYSKSSHDFICQLWNKDEPTFVDTAQFLVPIGLSLECLALLSGIIGILSRRVFTTSVLFASLFAFLSFIFTTIGITVFANESLEYIKRSAASNVENSRRWAMWLFIPNVILSFVASISFIFASILNWCDYRSMEATGILSHRADKYGGSVMKAPSESINTINAKKQHSMNANDYLNASYHMNGTNNNQNTIGYPPPPGYVPSMQQPGVNGTLNPAFQTASAFFGPSRPPSPTYPNSNLESYHHRHCITENSDTEDTSRVTCSRRHSRSCRHSSRRSRSRSPRDNSSTGNNAQNNSGAPAPQFIPIPVPYYQPPAQPPPPPPPVQTSASIQTATQTLNTVATTTTATTNTNTNTNNNNQTTPYFIQPQKKFFDEATSSTNKVMNMLTYGSEKPSLILSNPTQPIYTIAYRANPTASVLTSNILTGPAATTYVTATRDQITELHTLNNNSDNEDRSYRTIIKRNHSEKIRPNEVWTWRKL